MIPYGKHSVDWRDALKVALQIKNGSLTQGQRIYDFEVEVARYVGSKYAVAVSSATAGLHISLLSLNLNAGSKVVTSPISFVASPNAAKYAGLVPIFSDVEKNTINLNPEKIFSSVNDPKEISAIIPVHYAGLPCNMKRIHELSQPNGVRIIEDAAHALGARYESGEKVGSCQYSDLTVFSFHPVKIITTGEGGVVTTNSEILYKRLLRLRSHGINKMDDTFETKSLAYTDGVTNLWYYEMQELGFNYRLTEIQAALGISQMRKLDSFLEARREQVAIYNKAFLGQENISPVQAGNSSLSSNHLYPIRIDFGKLKLSRNEFMRRLRELGIGSQVHYMPIPLHPYYSKLGYLVDSIPEAMDYYLEALSIPLFPGLKSAEQKKVIRSILRLTNPSSISN